MVSALASKSVANPASLGFYAGIAYDAFRKDQASGTYDLVPTDRAVFERAQALGLQCGPRYRVCALDILHVAAALHHGATAFGTFDIRQAKMARDEGLRLLQ